MNLETKIRKLREKYNWSQMEVANQLDISQSAYNKWETGQSKPKIQNLEKLAEIFKIDLLDLIQFQSSNNNINYTQNTINDDNSFFEKLISNHETILKLMQEQNIVIKNILEHKHK